MERARVLCRQRKEDVALELDEVLPGVALRRRAGIRRVERRSSREVDDVRLAYDARDVVDDDVATREALEDDVRVRMKNWLVVERDSETKKRERKRPHRPARLGDSEKSSHRPRLTSHRPVTVRKEE